MLRQGDRVLQDRYPRGDALQARVIKHCPCCDTVTLYDVNGDDEDQPIFEPAAALWTIEEWELYNDADWPESDGFEEFKSSNPQLF